MTSFFSTPSQPRKHPVPPRLNDLAQFLLRKRIRAFEINVEDADLRRFFHFERDAGAPRAIVRAGDVLYFRLRIAGFLIQLFDLFGVSEEFALVERIPDFGR
jgi:hypothetical protein